jgi:hypothetical protein
MTSVKAMAPQFCIGIDLGTTNSVLAFAPIEETEAMIGVLPIPQVISPGSIENRLSLPSFLYLPDTVDASLQVPGIETRLGVVGEYARRISAEQPERVVAAAKSWLCNAHVDRQSDILPWQSDAGVPLVSPVAATAAYLQYLIDAWQLRFPEAPFAEQKVVLTIPASFDVAARDLTRQAAMSVGFPEDFVFLEEPQAALYNWVHARNNDWRRHLQQDDILLVCDVGGGTTDLTLVRVESERGELVLNRLAVGNHLLVGGDNMDLALAHVASELFAQKGVKLNAWQSLSLWHSCRLAKEKLLSRSAPDSFPLTLLGRGSKLIGGSISAQLERSLVERVLVDGFFPLVASDARPLEENSSGFQELGLPFASDSAVTRHLAAFLQDHAPDVLDESGNSRLTHLLFNGGVFNAEGFRSRLIDTLTHWRTDETPPVVLGGVEDLDQAVACGAAYYAWSRQHGGIRIRGGTPRSYYVGIESSGPSIPGIPRPLHALCVVAAGMEEGTETSVASRPIGIQVGQPARFRFFSSTVRKQDAPGTLLKDWEETELQETSPMEVELPKQGDQAVVPVTFHSRITELGVFELSCQSTRSDDRWQLEMNVRE